MILFDVYELLQSISLVQNIVPRILISLLLLSIILLFAVYFCNTCSILCLIGFGIEIVSPPPSSWYGLLWYILELFTSFGLQVCKLKIWLCTGLGSPLSWSICFLNLLPYANYFGLISLHDLMWVLTIWTIGLCSSGTHSWIGGQPFKHLVGLSAFYLSCIIVLFVDY